ncbi:prolipoprotein diacylglyceryl transferase [Paenibacillus sp. Dod16]|uniref:prolipoprotein diacylglyceryl transferase n=1 Tax=Paenibacillus sp. Dod16 TaxID=3416392 RepID=UPI003CEED757
MYNELIRIGPVTIYGYGLMIAIGILIAYKVVVYRAASRQVELSHVSSLTFWSLLGGLAGAKLLFWITQMNNIIHDPSMILNFSEGFVVYGGIIGGIGVGYVYCKKKKLNFLKYLDLFVPSVALAQGCGRIGCLLAGCCHGKETDSWFGITFHESELAPNDVKLIPTQILESVLSLSIFFILMYIARRKRTNGLIAGLYLIFYSLGRFIIEFFRGDIIRGQFGTLATSQWIALAVVLITCIVFLSKAQKMKTT